MSSDERTSIPAAVTAGLKSLSFGGVISVLWTIVVCVALHRCDKEVLEKYWGYLYWTWVAAAGLWLLSYLGAVISRLKISWTDEEVAKPTATPKATPKVEDDERDR